MSRMLHVYASCVFLITFFFPSNNCLKLPSRKKRKEIKKMSRMLHVYTSRVFKKTFYFFH